MPIQEVSLHFSFAKGLPGNIIYKMILARPKGRDHWTGPTDLPILPRKSMINAWPEAKVHPSCFHPYSLFWSNVKKPFFLETSLFALNMTWLHCEVYWDLNLHFKVAGSQISGIWRVRKPQNTRNHKPATFQQTCLSSLIIHGSNRWVLCQGFVYLGMERPAAELQWSFLFFVNLPLFRWKRIVRPVFAQCPVFQRTPEKVYNGMAWIDLSWMMALTCVLSLGRQRKGFNSGAPIVDRLEKRQDPPDGIVARQRPNLLFPVTKDCVLKNGLHVGAPWNCSDMGQQQIFSLLYDGCWNSESYLLVPNKIQSLVSLRLAL